MNNLVTKNVPFCGAELLAVQDEFGKIYAGINSILRELGFDENQVRYRRDKWMSDKVISKGVRKFLHPSINGGNQETYCIDIKKLPLALAKLDITPKMEKDMSWLSGRLEEYQESCADVLADAFLETEKKKTEKKKKNLSAANMLVKTVSGIFKDAGVDPMFIAAEAKRLYKEQADIDIQIPLITDSATQTLWDCTTMAKKLGIYSESGRPHDKAVSAIIQKIDLFTDEIVKTAYSRNGHDGVTVQYKESVLEKVQEWLEENGYPSLIEFRLANGSVNKCRVCYQEVA